MTSTNEFVYSGMLGRNKPATAKPMKNKPINVRAKLYLKPPLVNNIPMVDTPKDRVISILPSTFSASIATMMHPTTYENANSPKAYPVLFSLNPRATNLSERIGSKKQSKKAAVVAAIMTITDLVCLKNSFQGTSKSSPYSYSSP